MARPDNAIDFWRGFALITIFINHIPGIYYERFTHRNISFSDSAELFVFLAGWALRISIDKSGPNASSFMVVRPLAQRAFTLYVVQIFITTLALGMLAAAARLLDNPLLLEWHNAAPVFYDPVSAHLGLILLTHQLGYFDILPLYVTLMLFAPLMALVHRSARSVLLPASLALYFVTLIFRIELPSWPSPGHWLFNPLAWQLVFVLGFEMAGSDGVGSIVQRNLPTLRLVAIPIVCAAGVVVLNSWWPDLTTLPEPKLFFIVQKTFVTPMRLIQFLALAALVSASYPWFVQWTPSLVSYFAMLGRHSLNVFCVGSLASLAAQIVRFAARGAIGLDTTIVIVGVALLGFTAWVSEWSERVRRVKSGAQA